LRALTRLFELALARTFDDTRVARVAAENGLVGVFIVGM